MTQSECPGRDAFRILLVSPVDKAVLGQDFYFKFPHLSLPTLAAYALRGVEVKVVDEEFHALSDGRRYDLVDITAMTPLAPKAYLGSSRRRLAPQPHLSEHPYEAPWFAQSAHLLRPDEQWHAADDPRPPLNRRPVDTRQNRRSANRREVE